MNAESPPTYRKHSVIMPPKLDFSGILSKNNHRKTNSLFGSFRPLFSNPIPQETPTTDEQKQPFSFEEDYMQIPTEREDEEFRSKLDTMRSNIRNNNLETQEAESFLNRDRDREPTSSNRDAAWTDGLSRGRMLDSRLVKQEFSELEDFEISPAQIMLTEENRDREDETKEYFDTERPVTKKVTWGTDTDGKIGSRDDICTLVSLKRAEGSSILSTESKNWKKARTTFNAMKFSIGAEEAVEKKITNVMKGVQALEYHDSLTQNKKKRIFFIINPNNIFKRLWDMIISVTIVYYALVAPYLWSQRIVYDGWLWGDIVLDCMTLADIILHFFTGIPKADGVIKDIKVISLRYLKTFFIIDFLAMLPLYLISAHFYILKFLRVIHLGKTHKLLKAFCFQIHFRGQDVLKIFRMIFILIIIVNLLVCFWIFLGKTVTLDETWLGDLRYEDITDISTLVNLYIEVCLFVVATITTVGYGNIMMTNYIEQLATMLVEISGNLLIAFLQSQFIYLIYTNNNVQNKIRKEDLDLERWLAKREQFHKEGDQKYKKFFSFLDDSLHTTIDGIYTFFRSNRAYNYHNLTYNVDFFKKLAPSVQDQIIQESFSGLINKFHLFFNTANDASFTKEVISQLRLKIFPPYKKIVKRGDPLKGLYFIMKGKVLISYDNMLLLSFSENSFFGESMLSGRNIELEYIASEVAKGEGLKCLYIPRHIFLDLCYRYPHVMSSLQEIASVREEFFEKRCAQAYKIIKSTVQNRLLKIATMQNDPIPEKEEAEEDAEEDVIRPDSQPLETKPTERHEPDMISTAKSPRPLLKLITIPMDDHTTRANKYRIDDTTPESCNFSRITDRGASPFKHIEKTTKNTQTGKSPHSMKWDPHAFDNTVDEKMTPQAFRLYLDQLFECKSPVRDEGSPLKKPSGGQTPVVEVDGIFKIMDTEEDRRKEKTTPKMSFEQQQVVQKGDDSDEDDHELDNSMEIPVDMVDPTFEETDESDMIIEYLEKRIDMIYYKMERLKKVFREELINDWKKVKKVKKHVEGESEVGE